MGSMDTGPSGCITAAAKQRAEQLRQEGYDVQMGYFTSMEAFIVWAEGLSIGEPPDCVCPFTHVEFFAHGSSYGPFSLFPSQPAAPQQLPWWQRLGNALRRIMAGGGHIIFGWCYAADPAQSEGHPAGVTAGAAGAPVYGPGGEMWFPQGSPPDPVGHPYSQPHPKGPTGQPSPEWWPPDPPLPEGEEPPHGGWHRFPPTLPGWDDENDTEDPSLPPVPNGSRMEPPEVVEPEELDSEGRGKLPRNPSDPKQPPVPLVGPDGQTPLNHPENGTPLVDPQGDPLMARPRTRTGGLSRTRRAPTRP